ncbi:MAG: hypothetical protein HRT57_15930 [Crocinitomicaceae bacterium]|nr:hypothetical protein [Crocinitomicaceae bacterium]
MLKLLLSGLLIGLFQFSYAQGWVPSGGKSMSMANASVCNNDVWGFHNNPGALADVEKITVGLSYENRFLLKELQSQGIAVAVPLKMGVLSFGGHMYGYNQFRSYKAGLGYSMKLADKFYAGVQLNYQGLRLSQNYGGVNSMTAEVGVYGKITDQWKVGIAVFNLGRSKLSDYQDDRFSTIMRIGSSYTFSKKVMFSGEFEKDLDNPIRLRTGMEYQLINNFFVRGGFATAPVELTFGFGYKFKQIQLNFGSAYHQILGWSPHFSLVYQSK